MARLCGKIRAKTALLRWKVKKAFDLLLTFSEHEEEAAAGAAGFIAGMLR